MSVFHIFKESSNTFEGQEPGEKVIMLIRRHPFYIILNFVLFFLAWIIPALVAYIFLPYAAEYALVPFLFFLASLWLLLLWQMFFYLLTMYTLDVWIVTDRRVIDSTQHGFFSRTISELHVHRIQDISVQIQGPIQTLLHFGDLLIQTAGTEDRFKFIQIPRPEQVKNEIMKIAASKGSGTL